MQGPVGGDPLAVSVVMMMMKVTMKMMFNFFPTPHWLTSATLSIIANAALGS